MSALVFILLLLAACSSQPAAGPAKPAPKPTEAMAGREVMQRLFVQARGWAPDAKPVRLESTSTSDISGRDGKSAIWRAYFASPSRGGIRPYLWSGSGAERGVTPGTEDTWVPTNTSTQTFEFAFLKTDTDQALAVAQQHGGEKFLSANPKESVEYTLDWNPRRSVLVWHVTYGTRSDAKLAVDVDASTGKFIHAEK